jgi:hypothetical protein
LKLDDPFSRALTDWPNADRTTLRMLPTQTSGSGNDRRLTRHRSATARGLDWEETWSSSLACTRGDRRQSAKEAAHARRGGVEHSIQWHRIR